MNAFTRNIVWMIIAILVAYVLVSAVMIISKTPGAVWFATSFPILLIIIPLFVILRFFGIDILGGTIWFVKEIGRGLVKITTQLPAFRYVSLLLALFLGFWLLNSWGKLEIKNFGGLKGLINILWDGDSAPKSKGPESLSERQKRKNNESAAKIQDNHTQADAYAYYYKKKGDALLEKAKNQKPGNSNGGDNSNNGDQSRSRYGQQQQKVIYPDLSGHNQGTEKLPWEP